MLFLQVSFGVWFACMLGSLDCATGVGSLLSSKCDLSCLFVELFTLDLLFLLQTLVVYPRSFLKP